MNTHKRLYLFFLISTVMILSASGYLYKELVLLVASVIKCRLLIIGIKLSDVKHQILSSDSINK